MQLFRFLNRLELSNAFTKNLFFVVILCLKSSIQLSPVKHKYTNGKPLHDFLYDGNSNIFQSVTVYEIFAIKMYPHDLDL